MGLFDKPHMPDRKPHWMQEREKEQEQRIRSALAGLRNTYSSKSPFNVMLQGNRSMSTSSVGARNPGGRQYQARFNLLQIGPFPSLMSPNPNASLSVGRRSARSMAPKPPTGSPFRSLP